MALPILNRQYLWLYNGAILTRTDMKNIEIKYAGMLRMDGYTTGEVVYYLLGKIEQYCLPMKREVCIPILLKVCNQWH